MFYQQDWMLRQIEMLIQAIINLLSEKMQSFSEIHENDVQIQESISALLKENKICEAENLIFTLADEKKDDYNYFLAVLEFYKHLNSLHENDLNAHDFSHAEIKEGLLSFFMNYCSDDEIKKIVSTVDL